MAKLEGLREWADVVVCDGVVMLSLNDELGGSRSIVLSPDTAFRLGARIVAKAAWAEGDTDFAGPYKIVVDGDFADEEPTDVRDTVPTSFGVFLPNNCPFDACELAFDLSDEEYGGEAG